MDLAWGHASTWPTADRGDVDRCGGADQALATVATAIHSGPRLAARHGLGLGSAAGLELGLRTHNSVDTATTAGRESGATSGGALSSLLGMAHSRDSIPDFRPAQYPQGHVVLWVALASYCDRTTPRARVPEAAPV
jgi:hypothetical protein